MQLIKFFSKKVINFKMPTIVLAINYKMQTIVLAINFVGILKLMTITKNDIVLCSEKNIDSFVF